MGHYEHNSNWTRVFNQIGSGLCHSSEKEMNGRRKKTHVSKFRSSVLYDHQKNASTWVGLSIFLTSTASTCPWQSLTSWKLQDQFRQAEVATALFVPRTWRKGCHILKFGICWSTQKINQVSGIKYTGAISLSDSSILLLSMWRNKLSASLGCQ